MTPLTSNTLKYMGTVKDSNLPTSEDLKTDAEKFSEICDSFIGQMSDWKQNSVAMQNSEALDNFKHLGSSIEDTYDSIVQAVIDNVSKLSIFSRKIDTYAQLLDK